MFNKDMMKFFFFIIFMGLMVFSKNFLMMFMYNLCYLLSFMLVFFYMNKNDLWMMVGFYFGYDYYSFYLIFLTLWILGLMFMSLASEKSKMKLLIFLFMLLILLATFSTYNMIMFYFFFEVSLIPTFMLVIYWGYNPERISAGFYLLLYTLFISMPLLIFIINLNYGYSSFDFNLLIMMKLKSLGLFEYLMYMGSFFIKMPMFMFHIWLPKAHVEAPVYGSMVLAAILLKLGSYGLLRFIMILVKSMVKFNYLIFSVGIVGSILMSLVCLVQVDMKSLVAYSSVVHMNLMLCGMMVMTKMSFIGSYILMISHGLCSSGMFYMVNLYYYRTFSRFLVLNKGLMNLIPAMSFWWFLLCIINFSFPLSLNFMGEIFILSVILNWDMHMMMYLVMISFFSSCYSLYLFSYVQHGLVVKSGAMNSGKSKEFIVLILHVFPLVLMLINLVMWMA